MNLNRKGVALGLVVGALAGGGGAALATSGGTTTTPSTPSGGMPFRGPSFGMMAGHVGFGQNPVIAAVAGYLGLSQTDLQTQVQSGKTLAQIAQAQGKSLSGLEDAMVAAITSNLDADTTLTADQKAAILAQVKSRIGTLVNTGRRYANGMGVAGGFGPGAGPMMGGAWK
jgi:hypothetical protein